MNLTIRPYLESDAEDVADIFYDTIHSLGTEHYTQGQLNEWAPLPKDYDRWRRRLTSKPPFVAELAGRIVGFTTLEEDGHIDWTYTHKDFGRMGIASALYEYLEDVARRDAMKFLFVEASCFASPFFEKHGFRCLRRNETERNGQVLLNWTMSKDLASSG